MSNQKMLTMKLVILIQHIKNKMSTGPLIRKSEAKAISSLTPRYQARTGISEPGAYSRKDLKGYPTIPPASVHAAFYLKRVQ